MKKIIPALLLALTLFLFEADVFCQTDEDNYYLLVFKGDIIKTALSDYTDFKYFDLTYLRLEDGNYTLAGYARNNKNEQLGDLITLEVLPGNKARKFKNLEKGHLYLDLITMQNYNVDGSEDYVLTPKKCIDKSGAEVDYVSYRFSNKIENTSILIAPALVKSFNLNPSPPY